MKKSPCIIPKKTDDIYPIASDKLLRHPDLSICFCGCNRALFHGKRYYNKPKSPAYIMESINKIRDNFNIKYEQTKNYN
jgi:hypothetical protein